MAYRKIFEKKFRDAATATDALDAADWTYAGKKGLLKKYHSYTGLLILSKGEVREEYEARLHDDGLVELLTNTAISSTLGTTALPDWVYKSKDIYEHLHGYVRELNEMLSTEHGRKFLISWDGPKQFSVYALDTLPPHNVKVQRMPRLVKFSGPKDAFDWAVAESEK